MPDEKGEKRINYWKEAFLDQYNLIPLLGFAALGILAWPFWMLGAAYEIAWMGIVPASARFQRRVRAARLATERAEGEASEEELAGGLDAASRGRYDQVARLCEKIEAQADAAEPAKRAILMLSLSKLGPLRKSFLRMLASLHALDEWLQVVDASALQRSLEKVEREIEASSPKVRKVKERNRDILKERLARFQRAHEDRELLVAQLDTVENTLKLIRDDLVTLDNPQSVSDQIDLAVSGVQEGERLFREIEGLTTGVEDEAAPEAAAAEAEKKAKPERRREKA
jgi:hypothetical protein